MSRYPRPVSLAGALALLLVLLFAPMSAASAAPAPAPVAVQTQPVYYVVKWGDTLYSIGRRFGVSVQALRNANRITGNRIYAGQRIVIPGVAQQAPSITITPTSGRQGTRVSFSARGFPPNSPVTVWNGPRFGEPTFSMQATILPNGTLTGEMVAEGAPSSQVVFGIRTPNNVNAVSQPFVIANEPGPRASVTVAPTSGAPGAWVRVTATGFPYNVGVNIWGGPVASEGALLATGVTDADGRFSVQVEAQGEPGMRLVFGVTTTDGNVHAESPHFLINNGPIVHKTDVQYVMAQADVNMRGGPGTVFPIIGVVRNGQIARVTGTSADRGWWRVMCPDDTEGNCWLSAQPALTQPTGVPR